MSPTQTFANDVVAMFRQTAAGRLLECNDVCARVLGYSSAEELMTAGAIEYANRSDLAAINAALADLGTLPNVEVALRGRDGRIVWVLQNLRAVRGEGEGVIEVAMFDVTEQRVAAQRFEYQAYHDSVTGLPNRMLFFDRVNVALAHARRRGDAVALLVLDLDGFGAVNDRHGRAAGDRILRAAGERIAATIREEDAVARLEGDDFVILLAGMPYAGDAAIVASRLLSAIYQPYEVNGDQVRLHASIGVAIAGQDGEAVQALVRHAAGAAAAASERGGNAFRFYEPEMNQRAVERAAMVARLRKAVVNGELELYYQPEVNVQTGSIQCIEALLRWRHPDLGLIPPSDFLGAAEQGGLLNEITEIVLAKAFRQLRQWHDDGLQHMRIAVNLTANQLGERSIPSMFMAAAEEFRVKPSAVEVEFPELALSGRNTADVLRALKEIDLLLAIDDFGTGRCAITDLKRLPIDTIKIAPSLVRNMVRHTDDDAIVQAMLTMAKAMDLRVVAEGVESKEQFSFLLNRRCTEMQGYFVARPAPASGLDDILRMQHH